MIGVVLAVLFFVGLFLAYPWLMRLCLRLNRWASVKVCEEAGHDRGSRDLCQACLDEHWNLIRRTW